MIFPFFQFLINLSSGTEHTLHFNDDNPFMHMSYLSRLTGVPWKAQPRQHIYFLTHPEISEMVSWKKGLAEYLVMIMMITMATTLYGAHTLCQSHYTRSYPIPKKTHKEFLINSEIRNLRCTQLKQLIKIREFLAMIKIQLLNLPINATW